MEPIYATEDSIVPAHIRDGSDEAKRQWMHERNGSPVVECERIDP